MGKLRVESRALGCTVSSCTCFSSPRPFSGSFIHFRSFCIRTVNIHPLQILCRLLDIGAFTRCRQRESRQSVVVLSALCQSLPVLFFQAQAGLHFLAPCDGVGPYDNYWPMSCELKCCVCVCVYVCNAKARVLAALAVCDPSKVSLLGLVTDHIYGGGCSQSWTS